MLLLTGNPFLHHPKPTTMESKEIIEGDKLIAKFDGWVFNENDTVCREDHSDHGQLIELRIDILNHYHFSWDWLMIPCKKFSELEFDNDQRSFNHQEMCDTLDNNVTSYEIDRAWVALVKCIQWLNSQTPQP